MDRECWWATVNGVAKSQTRLNTYAQGSEGSQGEVRGRFSQATHKLRDEPQDPEPWAPRTMERAGASESRKEVSVGKTAKGPGHRS